MCLLQTSSVELLMSKLQKDDILFSSSQLWVFHSACGGYKVFKCNLFCLGDRRQQCYTNAHTLPLGCSNQEDAEQVLQSRDLVEGIPEGLRKV